MRKFGIIGLAIVAATAFGVWAASPITNSKTDVLAASDPISPPKIPMGPAALPGAVQGDFAQNPLPVAVSGNR